MSPRMRGCVIRWSAAALGIAGMGIAGMGIASPSQAARSAPSEVKDRPLLVEAVNGSKLSRLTLSGRAVARLGITTKPVTTATRPGTKVTLSVPYSAIIYDKHGDTWVYTSLKQLVFIRQNVTVETIERDLALLSKGPKVGTNVATVGVSELYGSELGVGGGH